MKRFLRIYSKDKDNIKMINQSDKGFELIILSNSVLNDLINTINSYKVTNDEIYIAWQMKFKPNNYILYKNCKFSEPIDNFRPKEPKKLFGKKIKVVCEGTTFYTNSFMYKNKTVQHTTEKYKDGKLLERMLKIGELNLISVEKEIRNSPKEKEINLL
jgi:hypothetical protein